MKNQQTKSQNIQNEEHHLNEFNQNAHKHNEVSQASCSRNYSYFQDISQVRDNTDRLLMEGVDKQTERFNIDQQSNIDQEIIQKIEDLSFYKSNYQDDLTKSLDLTFTNQKQLQHIYNCSQDYYMNSVDENEKNNEKDYSLCFNKQYIDKNLNHLISQEKSPQPFSHNSSNLNGQATITPEGMKQSQKRSILYDGDKSQNIKLREPGKSLSEYILKLKYAKLVAKTFKENQQKRASQRAEMLKQNIQNQEMSKNEQEQMADREKKLISQSNIPGIQLVDNFEKGISIIQNMLKFAKTKQAVTKQHVFEFLLKLKRKSKMRNLENLNQDEFSLLGDYYHLLQLQKKHSACIQRLIFKIFQQFYDAGEWLNKTIPVFLPSSNFKLFWDFFQILYTLSFFFFYSIYAFFIQDSLVLSSSDSEQIENSVLANFILYVSAVVFLLDIIVNFNTAFYNKDQIREKRSEIARKYIKSHFSLDLLSTIVLFAKIVLGDNHHNLSKSTQLIIAYSENIFIFSRVFSLKPKRKNLESSINLKQTQKYILKLIDLIFLAISFAHVVCILWNELAQFEDYFGFEVTWRSKASVPLDHWFKKYIYSVYWAVTTMSTVGYGDITPSNYIEALFVTINMLMMSCVFAYIINNVGMILQEIDKSSKELNQDIDTILRSRVRHYLNFVAKQQKDINKESEDKVFLKLSKKLRDEISIEINQKIINKYSTFQKYFSKQTLDKVILALQEIHVQPNEIIFNEQQLDDQAIYFLQSGQVEIYTQQESNFQESKQIILKQFNQSGLFGEISFFSGKVRMASARSLNLSTLYFIRRADFIEILSQNIEDLERFKMLEHQINCFTNISCIGIECYLCKEQGHTAASCKRTHYVPDHQFLILKDIFSFFQERNFQKRFQKSEKFLHALSFIRKNQSVKENLTNRIKNFEEIVQQYAVKNSDEEEESQNDEEFEEEEDEDDEETKNYEMKSQPSFSSQQKAILSNENSAQSSPSPEKNQRGSIFIKLSRPNEGEQPIIIEFDDIAQKSLVSSHQRGFSFDGEQEIKLESVQSPAFEPKKGDTSQLYIEDEIELRNSITKKDSYKPSKKDKKLNNDERRKLMKSSKSKSIDKMPSPTKKKRNSSIFSMINRPSLDQSGNLTNLVNSIVPHNSQNMNMSNPSYHNQNLVYNSNNGPSTIMGKDTYPLFSNNQINSSSRFSYHNQTSLISQVERFLQPITNNQTHSYSSDIEKKKFKESDSDLNLLGSKNSSNLSVLAQMQQTNQQLENNVLQKKVMSILQAALGNMQQINPQPQNQSHVRKSQNEIQSKRQSEIPPNYSFREDAYSNVENLFYSSFDKMKNFKTYFTYNNASKIIQDYKNKVYMINRQKKNKPKTMLPIERKRRGNIIENSDILLKGSPFQIKTSYFLEDKLVFDKPTYLSYGVAQQLGQQNPKVYYGSPQKQQKLVDNRCSIFHN